MSPWPLPWQVELFFAHRTTPMFRPPELAAGRPRGINLPGTASSSWVLVLLRILTWFDCPLELQQMSSCWACASTRSRPGRTGCPWTSRWNKSQDGHGLILIDLDLLGCNACQKESQYGNLQALEAM